MSSPLSKFRRSSHAEEKKGTGPNSESLSPNCSSLSDSESSGSSWRCHKAMSDDLQAGGSSVMEAHRRSNKDDQQLFLEELDKRDSVIALLTQRLKEVLYNYSRLSVRKAPPPS